MGAPRLTATKNSIAWQTTVVKKITKSFFKFPNIPTKRRDNDTTVKTIIKVKKRIYLRCNNHSLKSHPRIVLDKSGGFSPPTG